MKPYNRCHISICQGLVTGGVNVAFIALQSFSVSTYFHDIPKARKAVVTPYTLSLQNCLVSSNYPYFYTKLLIWLLARDNQ